MTGAHPDPAAGGLVPVPDDATLTVEPGPVVAGAEVAVWATGQLQHLNRPDEPAWERCTGPCGREYAYPHLCREHMLCGLCHPSAPERP